MRVLTYKHLIGALVAGFALRLFFITQFPFYSGDTAIYEELARNWIHHGVYGLYSRGQLFSVDIRMPGYPAFLAAIYKTLSESRTPVMVVQSVIDLGTCVITAMLAARLAPVSTRKAAATTALWIAALCPFAANYSAAIITETLAAFMTAAAILVLVALLNHRYMELPRHSFDNWTMAAFGGWLLGVGVITGFGTLVRPETPLVLIAAGAVLCMHWRLRTNCWKLALAGLSMAAGLLMTLLPWAVRNTVTMGRVEFLAPEFASSKGDPIQQGFFAWTSTWMTRYGDAYLVTWRLGNAPIQIEKLPRDAFDTEDERARVARLLSQYNSDLRMTPLLDYEFARLARERTERRPLRSYLFVPVERAWMIWFTPRIELLPYTGKLWPPAEAWHNNSTDFSVTLGEGVLNILLVGFALIGAWRGRMNAGMPFLVVYLLIRTAFLTQLHTVEPRYVIECMPILYAFAALAVTITRRERLPVGQPAIPEA